LAPTAGLARPDLGVLGITFIMNSEFAVFALPVDGGGTDCRVVIRGEVDMTTAPQLADCVASAVVEPPGDLIFDLTDTTFLDSAGLMVITSAQRRLPESCGVILRDPNPFIRRILAIARMDALCRIEG
jgi:anti-anti-sigma factor